jgi:hypothetical protein
MSDIRVEVKGTKGLAQALDRYGRKAKRALKAALFQEAEGIMTQAKQIVPVRDGFLKGSGHVRLPQEQSGGVSIELGFGGPAAPYAVIVHEDLNAFHKVGQAKYLEEPVNQAKPGMSGRIARDVRAATKGR